MALQSFKYPLLADLQKAYQSGELRPKDRLELAGSYATAFDKDNVQVFSMHSRILLEQALWLLGIPWEDA